jgi:hypothetical protein
MARSDDILTSSSRVRLRERPTCASRWPRDGKSRVPAAVGRAMDRLSVAREDAASGQNGEYDLGLSRDRRDRAADWHGGGPRRSQRGPLLRWRNPDHGLGFRSNHEHTAFRCPGAQFFRPLQNSYQSWRRLRAVHRWGNGRHSHFRPPATSPAARAARATNCRGEWRSHQDCRGDSASHDCEAGALSSGGICGSIVRSGSRLRA